MANLGPTITLVDSNGNRYSSGNGLPVLLTNNTALISTTNPLPVSEETTGVQLSQSSGPIAAAGSGAASLAGAAGKTTYIRGFVVSSQAVAAVVGGLVTVTGTISGTLHYQYVEAVATGGLLIVSFGNAGLAASGQNTAIAVNLPAIAGGAASAVVAWGVQI